MRSLTSIWRRGLIVVCVGSLVAGTGVALAVTHGSTRKAAAAADSTDGQVLTTITPYQLSELNLTLSPDNSSVPVTAQQADSVAQALFPSSDVEETALADCGIGDQPSSACYAVSLDPGHTPLTVVGAAETSDDSTVDHPPVYPTLDLVLVDAQSGDLLDAISSSVPAVPDSN